MVMKVVKEDLSKILARADITESTQWLSVEKRKRGAQAAGEGVDRPIKFSASEMRVFGSGSTWVSTFTKVILSSIVEAR